MSLVFSLIFTFVMVFWDLFLYTRKHFQRKVDLLCAPFSNVEIPVADSGSFSQCHTIRWEYWNTQFYSFLRLNWTEQNRNTRTNNNNPKFITKNRRHDRAWLISHTYTEIMYGQTCKWEIEREKKWFQYRAQMRKESANFGMASECMEWEFNLHWKIELTN